jgi:hypothetical protein
MRRATQLTSIDTELGFVHGNYAMGFSVEQ